jgi:16S rRNA (adenine1518-N6/adenine1519-N6)-dimethyltransferase
MSLLGPAEIRELAEALDLKPSKSLGQNFVHDGNTCRRLSEQLEYKQTMSH